MALDVMTQTALSNDVRFRLRVKNALHIVSQQVLNESTGTTGHAQRAVYARNALQSLDAIAGQISQWIVGRPNVIATNVTVDLTTGTPVVVCDVTDAAIQSQLATDWSNIANA
jgi:hypothetical protein